MKNRRSRLAVFLGMVFVLAPISWITSDQEIEEADLVELELGPDARVAPDLTQLEEVYAHAQQVFASADQPDAIPLLTEIIDRLQSRSTERALVIKEKMLLSRSLFSRGEVHFNLGETDRTRSDLRQAITTDPAMPIDLDQISPKLARFFESIRNELVGYIDFRLDPPDMEVRLDGHQMNFSSGLVVPVLAGVRSLVSTRPGYESIDSEVEVEAGTRFELELTLRRSSAVIVFSLQPSAAEILMDGHPAAASVSEPRVQDHPDSQSADRVDTQSGAIETSDMVEVMIGGLFDGSHTLELRQDGYRPMRIGFEVDEIRDYTLPGVVSLEVTRGEVTITGIPNEATVKIDGDVQGSVALAGDILHLELSPGEHLIEVEAGFSGRFEEVVVVADQDVLTVPVGLRPVVVLLGVLGDDGVAAPALVSRLTEGLGTLEKWYFFDRSAEAAPTLSALGVTAGALRETRNRWVAGAQGPDWATVQRVIDAQFKAPVFLLAVLSDDLFATTADLWIWAAEPYPSQPSIRRIALETSEDFDAVLDSFEEIMVFERLSFGASFIDSNASETPVVADIRENSPAALAGLKLGDRLLTIDGREVFASSEFREHLDSLHDGDEITVEIENSQGRHSFKVKPEKSPSVLSPTDRNLLLPVASAKLANEIKRLGGGHPEWLLKLNQAAILMHAGAWREAVPLLRTVKPSSDSPLGQAAVDYWLGRALMAADPVAYRDRAREAYARAAQDISGRLYHSDGPSVAPRAKRRLRELGGS